jgi:hypothetical protein
MDGGAAPKASSSPDIALFPILPPQVCIFQTKPLVNIESYHVVITANVRVTRRTTRLEGNTGKYTGGGKRSSLEEWGRSLHGTSFHGLSVASPVSSILQNVVPDMKSRGLEWLGHVIRMDPTRESKDIVKVNQKAEKTWQRADEMSGS